MVALNFLLAAVISVEGVEVHYDDTYIGATQLPQYDELAGSISYVSGTYTTDSLRYPNSDFPLTTTWYDSHNNKWDVSLQNSADRVYVTYPCSSVVQWNGDEVDYTRFDQQCTFCETAFSYEDGGAFHSHGIHIDFKCYSDDKIGYKLSGGYDEVIKQIEEGVTAAAAIAALLDGERLKGVIGNGIEVNYNGVGIAASTLPQYDELAGSISYVSGTYTTDSLRYPNSDFPLTTTWYDSHNNKWDVSLQSSADRVYVTYPCSSVVQWNGDEVDYTRFDQQCTFCETAFSYEDGGAFHSHGIHIDFKCYSDDKIGYKLSGGYDEVIKQIEEGVTAAAAIAALLDGQGAVANMTVV